MSRIFEAVIGDRTLTIETGKVAGQANGAVTVSYGDTVVLVTVCAKQEEIEGRDFVPLTVDYEERLYAAGKIPGSFFRREGRSTQAATLAARLTDRPIRPLLNKKFHHEMQIVITVLSADQENDPDVLAIIGASAALSISDIPFEGPLGAVRIGYIDNEFMVNPTFTQLQRSSLDLVVVSTGEKVMTVEGGAREMPEDVVLEAIKLGHETNREIIDIQEQLKSVCGKPKIEIALAEASPQVEEAVRSSLGVRLVETVRGRDKLGREEALSTLKEELLEELGGIYPPSEILSVFDSLVKVELRSGILETGIRLDGRGISDIRPIECEVKLLPRTHGSAMFTRGQTQVLTITTLGSLRQEQPLDGLGQEESKRFMHHYNFPPFSTGEVKRMGSPGRREIGHGALAERALTHVIPDEGEFPYTIRLVSEVLSSAGSTSMASTCAGTLALMDAGVPIAKPVAGIAMGLVTGEGGQHVILTDIEGIEDANGDMDFKVAGTVSGVTALQMDTKLKGLSCEVLGEALKRAQDARLLILDKMRQAIAVSRAELSQYAPRTIKVKINREKIGALIGPGGRTIRSIQSETKARVDVEEDGTVLVSSTSEEAAQKALKTIEELTREVQVGDIYTGKVVRIMDFGAFVEILPGKEGLVHISELADYRVASVGEVVKVGDEIMVKLIEIDRMGRLNLSRKAVFEDSSESAESSAKRQADTHPGYRRSGGGAGIPTRSYHHPRGEQTSPKSYPSRMPHKNLPHRR